MLTSFSVENFRGFKEKITFDLTQVNNYEFNAHVIKDSIIKNGLIYGPNGSGKSNFTFALFDIVLHLTDKNKIDDYYKNFLCLSSDSNKVNFEYNFILSNKKICYTYSKNEYGVLVAERLECDKKNIFEKTEDNFTIDEEFNLSPESRNALKNTATNTNAVSIIRFIQSSFPLAKEHFITNLLNFVNSMLWFRTVTKRSYMGLLNGSYTLDDIIIKKGWTKEFEDFLFQMSNQKFTLQEESIGNRGELLCDFGKKKIRFNEIASTGTSELELLFFWYKHVQTASFICIDEFDAFYHFELSYKICEMFFKIDTTQIFLTTHNTFLLNNELLRPDCLFVLDDGKIAPLSNLTHKELRFAHNLEKMFRAGSFNGKNTSDF